MIFLNVVAIGGGSKLGGTPGTDYLGHAGGAIAGLFWGLAFFPRAPSEYGAKLKMWGLCLTVTFFALMFLLFYLTSHT